MVRLPPKRSWLAVIALLLCVILMRVAAEDLAPDYRNVNPVELAGRLREVLESPERAEPKYWQAKPILAATLEHPLHPEFRAADRAAARDMKRGRFQPAPMFPSKKLGVPPPWNVNPLNNRSWDFQRHALRWMRPLVKAWKCEGDAESLALATRTIEDWIRTNSKAPGASPYAWDDHATAQRARILCWFWELRRASQEFDPDLARLLLASVYQHAVYLADERNYLPTSNHGMQTDASLLAIAIGFPEFKQSGDWRRLAAERLGRWVERNFSAEGFHLEQSPAYHFYAMRNVGLIIAFLRANDEPIPDAIKRRMESAIAVYPYLIRLDGKIPNVGDSDDILTAGWRATLTELWSAKLPPIAPSSAPNPRDDQASFILCFQVGYAIFTSYPVGRAEPESDTHALFRSHSFRGTHGQRDALSFELFGLGRDWLVDSGKLTYEDTPAREYMCSARAHNVVLVDNVDFDFHTQRLLDVGRTQESGFVKVRHYLPKAEHTRRFDFHPPRSIVLTDELTSTDGEPHTYTQLFHVSPGTQDEVVSPRETRLSVDDGRPCIIQQRGDQGEWSVVKGQREPLVQGWYSREYNKMVPSDTLHYTTPQPALSCTFVTQITLQPKHPLTREVSRGAP